MTESEKAKGTCWIGLQGGRGPTYQKGQKGERVVPDRATLGSELSKGEREKGSTGPGLPGSLTEERERAKGSCQTGPHRA